jgi:excisionase family DNA binding protein
MKLSEIRTDIIVESDDENDDVSKAPAPGKLGEFITTKQAAKILKVSPSRVRQFIQDGRLKTYSPEVGRRDNMLKLSAVQKLADKERPITGRPDEGKGTSTKEDKKED